MLHPRTAVSKEVGAVAARNFEGIAEDRHTVKRSVVVDRFSKRNHGRRSPCRTCAQHISQRSGATQRALASSEKSRSLE